MIEAILWDHDGVLADTEPWFYEATRRTLAEHGIEIAEDDWVRAQADGRHLEQIVPPDVVESLDFRVIRRLRDELYGEFLRTEHVTVDGAVEMVRSLSARFRMALVTNSRRRFVDALHGGGTLLSCFETVVTAEDCRRGKPDPDPYVTALERLGVPPTAAVCIEDSGQGLRSATAAGVRCIIVRNAFMASHDVEGAWVVLDSVAELPGLLQGDPGGMHG